MSKLFTLVTGAVLAVATWFVLFVILASPSARRSPRAVSCSPPA
jgi:hypothetical protein